MTYTATITSGSLRLRESRIVADLLLRQVSAAEWREAIVALSASDETARSIAGLCGRWWVPSLPRRRLPNRSEYSAMAVLSPMDQSACGGCISTTSPVATKTSRASMAAAGIPNSAHRARR